MTLKDVPGDDWDVSYGYDNVGQLLSAAGADQILSFTYSPLGRNLSQSGPHGTVSYQYDLAGRRTRMIWPGSGLFVDYDYLVTGEVTKIRENGATSGPGVLAAYAYDDSGRRTSLTRGNGTVTSYSYDPVSRLSQLVQDLPGSANDLTLGFDYNPAGQIVSNTRSNDAYAFTGHANQNLTLEHNGLNQISGGLSIAHGLNGNISEIGTADYGYTSENLMVTAPGPVTLAYDPLLRLYETAGGGGTTRFAYDGGEMIAEYNGSNQLLRRFVHGPGVDEPLVWYEGAGTATRRWFHADERGSIVAVSDASGNLFGSVNRYDEYGAPQGTLTGRFGYTGQAWLPEIGLWYYRARMYNPQLGQFMQTDPIGYGSGMNLYAYVLNDPVNLTDPSGLAPCNFADVPDDIPVCGSPMPEPQPNGMIAITAAETRIGRSEGGVGGPDAGEDPPCPAEDGSRHSTLEDAILAAARAQRAEQRSANDNNERSFVVNPFGGPEGGFVFSQCDVGTPDHVDLCVNRNSRAAGHVHTIGGGNTLSRRLNMFDRPRDVEIMNQILNFVRTPDEFVTVLVGENGNIYTWRGPNLDADPDTIGTDQCPR